MEVIESFSQAQTISELDSSQFAQVLELWILEQTRLELYLSLPSGQKKDEVISVFWSLVDAEVELAESLGVPGLRSSPGDVDTMRNLLSTLFKKVSDVNCCNRGCPGCLFSNGSMAGPVFG